MSEHEDPHLSPGTRVAHYEIEAKIGEGAMGVVYRAHDTALDRAVAIKVLKSAIAEDDALVTRFVREARAAAKVNHPHLTHIYFVGEQDGAHFFVMELLPGQDLEEKIKNEGPVTWEEALDILIQTARGLSAAHAADVIHRDVKPSNVILQPDGQAKVTDFGLAKSLHADIEATQAGSLVGTPTFMSPEQCRGRTVDARTDVYALGLTGWYLLTGEPPHQGETLGDMLDRQMNEPLPSLAERLPDVPVEFDEALRTMCEKDPESRPQDMEATVALLRTCRPGAMHPAGLFTRAVALAIDVALTLAILAIVWLFIGLESETERWGSFLFALIWTPLQLGLELWTGQTFGKWMMQLHVVSASGGRARPGPLFARFLIRSPHTLGWLTLGAVLTESHMWPFDILWALAIVGGLAVFAWTEWKRPPGRTLSDILTRTRVAYRIPLVRLERDDA